MLASGGRRHGTRIVFPRQRLQRHEILRAYTELFGAGSTYYVHFFDGISINENSSVEVFVQYSGVNNTFDAYVVDSSGNSHLLKSGDLYYPADHAAAHSEVVDWDDALSATCPTLTNGSPYQNNGTEYNGDTSADDELWLQDSQGNASQWQGSPDTYDGSPYYWFHQNSDWPASFRANGPSDSEP